MITYLNLIIQNNIDTVADKIKKEIWAYGRKAIFERTIEEDADGKWDNEGLSIDEGYVVIHAGKKHYVYRFACSICGETLTKKNTSEYYPDMCYKCGLRTEMDYRKMEDSWADQDVRED